MWLGTISMTLLMLVGFFLIFIILLQRGRGGGLAGALGGMGGQSALGTKAGDVFTKITVVVAVAWVVLAASSVFALRTTETAYTGGAAAPSVGPGEEEGDEGTEDGFELPGPALNLPEGPDRDATPADQEGTAAPATGGATTPDAADDAVVPPAPEEPQADTSTPTEAPDAAPPAGDAPATGTESEPAADQP